MDTRPISIDTIENDLEGLFRREFESQLASKEVSLTTQRASANAALGRVISIQPAREGCAQITAFCENGGEIVYLTIGRHTPLEVPLAGGRYTQFKGVEELMSLVRTVAAGRFEETLWVKNSQVMRSVGRLFIDAGRPIKIVDCELSKLFGVLASRKQVQKYLPYA